MTYKNKYTVEKLKDIIKNSKTWAEVCVKLNLKKYSYNGPKRMALKENIDFSHFESNAVGRYGTISKVGRKKFELIIKESFSYSQVAKKLELAPKGGTYQTIKNYIKMWSIDTKHFTGKGWNAGKTQKKVCDYTSTASRRKALIAKRGHKCENCKLSEWQNKQIPIELHHINGDRNNNKEENLQLLCSNCHALTPNFRNRKRN